MLGYIPMIPGIELEQDSTLAQNGLGRDLLIDLMS